MESSRPSDGSPHLLFAPPPLPLASPAFFRELEAAKLREWRLDGRARPFALQQSCADGALVASLAALPERRDALPLRGQVISYNTREAFAAADKDALMRAEAAAMLDAIASGAALADPTLLSRALLLHLADAKNAVAVSWLALPALVALDDDSAADDGIALVRDVCRPEVMSTRPLYAFDAEALRAEYGRLCRREREYRLRCGAANEGAEEGEAMPVPLSVLVARPTSPDCAQLPTPDGCAEAAVRLMSLREAAEEEAEAEAGAGGGSPPELLLLLWAAEAAPVSSADPLLLPWHYRNLLALVGLRFRWASYVRCVLVGSAMPPLLVDLRMTPPTALAALVRERRPATGPLLRSITAVGWQADRRGVLAPRALQLRDASSDIASVAESALQLNLALMRWRMLPELDLESISALRCLLLGAGTLGCHLARSLLAWGVRHLTLVDSGRVSFSNPARQPLYEFSDAQPSAAGVAPRFKADAAADALRRIHPAVDARGIVLEIPSPGHAAPPVGSVAAEAQAAAVAELDSLIEAHDVIFLLTDSRESRWLPTLLAASRGRPAFTLALAFDSLLVLRHGVGEGAGKGSCYFCADVVAPGDSSKDKAMDLQCTVTRPGLAPIACALAAELTVALLHHPLGFAAPCDDAAASQSPMGAVPQQLRFSLTTLQPLLGATPAFEQCTACSARIVRAFREGGAAFLGRALGIDGPAFLERVSGLAELKAGAEAALAALARGPGDDEEESDSEWACT